MATNQKPIETQRPADLIEVTAYWGGAARGECLQLTQSQGFIQVTKSDAIKVAARLLAWATEEKNGEEETEPWLDEKE